MYAFKPPQQMQEGLYSYEMGGMVGPGGAPAPRAIPLQAPQPQMPMHSMPDGSMMPGASHPGGMGGMGGQGPITSDGDPNVQMDDSDSPEEIRMIHGALTSVLQQPQMYPHIRQTLIQQGLVEAADLPPQFNPQFVQVLVSEMDKAMSGAGQPMGNMPVMKYGGMVPHKGGGKKDKPVPIMAHENEFVIPANVVKAKGTEFFQKLIDSYDPKMQNKKLGGGGSSS